MLFGAVAASLLTSTLSVSAATETAVRTYDTSGLHYSTHVVTDSIHFVKIDWEGMNVTATPGAPELPVEYIRFLVPVYTKVTGVTVSGANIFDENINTPIFPAQEPQIVGSEVPADFTMPDAEAYSADYPIRAEYVDDGFVDGCNHIVTVAVYPMSYNPTTGYLAYTDQLTVTLEYESCDASVLTSTPIFPPHRSRYLDLENMVVNPSVVSNRNYAPRVKASNDTIEYYYIITPRNLKDAFEDLVAWKRQKGYHVVVKSIEDVYADSRYAINSIYTSIQDGVEYQEEVKDSAMSLRCYLKDQFAEHGQFFCLLVGDWRTPMPMRKFVGEYFKNEIYDIDNIDNSPILVPSDKYFVDLGTKYDLVILDNHSIYTDTISSNFDPTINVGRVFCSTSEEVSNYIHKLILYEGNPGRGDNDYLGKVFHFESCNLHWENDVFNHVSCLIATMQSGLQQLRNKMREHGFDFTLLQDNTHVFYPSNVPLDPESIELPSSDGYFPTGEQLINQIQENGISLITSHGSPHGFIASARKHILYNREDAIGQFPYISSKYSNLPGSGLDNMTNFNKPIFFFANSCSLAPYDELVVLWDGEQRVYTGSNFGHSFMSSGLYGAVGAILSSRPSFTDGGSMFINYASNIFNQPIASISFQNVCNNLSKLEDHNRYVYNFHGDPEFEIWLGKPNVFNYTLNPTSERVSVSGISSGISCILSNGEDNIVKTNFSGLIANRPIIFTNPFEGEYCFSMWKTGYLPIITLLGQRGTLSAPKRYVVRDVILGNQTPSESTYTITSGGVLSVKAIDNVALYSGFIVDENGEALIECDGTVNLNGGIVRPGGKLTIKAKNVKIGTGFKVEAGGKFKIEKIN